MSIEAADLDGIKNIVGQGGFIDDAAAMRPYLTSWRNGWTGKSPLIALPAATAQVAAIVALCRGHKIPVVPQGGNTGLVGGCIPSQRGDQIVVNLSRMNKIRAIDAAGMTVTAEAGVVLQTLQEAASAAGFLFPLSMASEGSAQVGGAVATNAGGTAVLRYGSMRDLVMGVEVVLANGQIISGLEKLPKDNAGYDLGRAFIGSEGTLGIVTAATLKLFPALRQKFTAVVALPAAAAALELLGDFRRETGEYLTAFEAMSHAALKLVTKHMPGARFPGASDAPWYLLIELGSSSPAAPLRELFEYVAGRALESGEIRDAVIAENSTQARQFWALRENVSESLRKEGPGIHFDISLPLARWADFLRETEIKIKTVAPDVTLAPFGHIGDGNIHYNMCFAQPPAPDTFAAIRKKIQDIVYGEVKNLSGSISAEHGIGLDRKSELLSYKPPAEIELMKSIKRALDPDGILNPGKIFDV